MNVIYSEMQIPKNYKLSPAFTLVELLVVISVIGLLMGILVPALGKARRTANRTYCKANLRQLGVAMRAYLDDSRDIFPPACNIAYAITDMNNPMYRPPITKFLGPLLKEPKVFICKADTVKKYYLINKCNINYEYKGFQLGGRTIRELREVQRGVKEKNIEVMNDFDDFHPISGTPPPPGEPPSPSYVIGINYLYADWHVGDIHNQD
jgi:prepilin-type N-terminal cleavage/methylation domain-containing protein/prepilin-type processing-associated H-X9-DG protein